MTKVFLVQAETDDFEIYVDSVWDSRELAEKRKEAVWNKDQSWYAIVEEFEVNKHHAS